MLCGYPLAVARLLGLTALLLAAYASTAWAQDLPPDPAAGAAQPPPEYPVGQPEPVAEPPPAPEQQPEPDPVVEPVVEPAVEPREPDDHDAGDPLSYRIFVDGYVAGHWTLPRPFHGDHVPDGF